MKHIPLDLKLTLSDTQIGVLQAKANVIEMCNRLDAIDCSNADGSISALMLFENRAKIISGIVNRLGKLDEFQKGYLSSLFEYIEIAQSGGMDFENWRPSLLTGEWQ